MQRIAISFLFVFFLFSTVVANGRQPAANSEGESKGESAGQHSENRNDAGFSHDCGNFFNAAFQAEQVLENDSRILSPVKSDGDAENDSEAPRRAAFQRDREIL